MPYQIKQTDRLTAAGQYGALLFPIAMLFGNAGADIAGSTLVVLFVVHVIRQKQWPSLYHPWIISGSALWAFKIASALWAYDPSAALRAGFIWGRFPVFGIALAYWVFTDPRITRYFFAIIVACLTFLAVDGIYQYYFGVDVFGIPKYNQYANTDILGHVKVGDRLTGPSRRPVLGANILYLAFPIIMYAIHADLPWRRQLFYRTLSLCCIYVVVLSGERSQLLLLVLGLALISLTILQKRMFSFFFLSLGLLTCIFVLQIDTLDRFNPSSPDYIEKRQIFSTLAIVSDVADSPYGRIWKDALRLAKQHSLFGVGEGNIRVHWCDLGERKYYTEGCPLHPHNIYLEMLASNGLIGFALYILTLFFIMRYFLYNYVAWRDSPLITGIFIALCVRIWPLIAVTSYTRAASSFSFWLIIGWGIALIGQRIATGHRVEISG